MESLVEPLWTLFLNADHTAPQVLPFAGGKVAIFSRRCRTRDGANEDAAALLAFGEESGLLAVADGCGGMASGELAAKAAIESLEASLASADEPQANIRAAVLDGFEKANRHVLELGSGAATTLAVVEIDGPVMRPYHVGDSTILLLGNRGRMRLITTSHSPVGYAVQAGILDEHEAIHHEDRHLVSNVIGTQHYHIEIGSRRKMHALDTVVIGSDGLFDNLLLTEVVEIVRKGPLQRAALRLAEMASERMAEPTTKLPSKPDDLTFILFRPGRRTDGRST
jgi:serine/threonine protein phosphatase PrpC